MLLVRFGTLDFCRHLKWLDLRRVESKMNTVLSRARRGIQFAIPNGSIVLS